MAYLYTAERPKLASLEHQADLLRVAFRAQYLIERSGAFLIGKALNACENTAGGWERIALIDRLVELGYILEVTGPDVAGQDRVFIAGEAL